VWRGRDDLRMSTVRNTDGFTLVEMMMALVVLAVLLAVAAPGFSELIKNNRMLSEVYALRAALNGARSEALAQRNFVTLCRSDDGADCGGDWNDGYIAFLDVDGDGSVDDPNSPDGDRIFVSRLEDSSGTINLAFSNTTSNRVRFDGQGYARSFDGVFTFCDDRKKPDAKRLAVTAVGVVRALDPNEPPAFTCP
jgi:type IV fimbrial biogenesis protein FimT